MRAGLGKRLKNQGNVSCKGWCNHAVGKDRHTLATDLIRLSSRVKTVECRFCDTIKTVWISYFSCYDQIYLIRSNVREGRDLFWLVRCVVGKDGE